MGRQENRELILRLRKSLGLPLAMYNVGGLWGLRELSRVAKKGAMEPLALWIQANQRKAGFGLHYPKLGQFTMSSGLSLLVESVVVLGSGTMAKIGQ